jgi:hypothetical protein
VAGFCEHGNEPSGSINKVGCCLRSWMTISFSKDILHHGVSKVACSCQLHNNKHDVQARFDR